MASCRSSCFRKALVSRVSGVTLVVKRAKPTPRPIYSLLAMLCPGRWPRAYTYFFLVVGSPPWATPDPSSFNKPHSFLIENTFTPFSMPDLFQLSLKSAQFYSLTCRTSGCGVPGSSKDLWRARKRLFRPLFGPPAISRDGGGGVASHR